MEWNIQFGQLEYFFWQPRRLPIVTVHNDMIIESMFCSRVEENLFSSKIRLNEVVVGIVV